MGLTIHYSGRIANKRKLPQLIEELEEIATVHGWEYHIFEREFPVQISDEHDRKLYGIWFTPPKSDPVSITFLCNGRLSSPMQLMNWGDSTKPKEKELLYRVFTKTQYAGVEIHKMVIAIFRYLNKQYLTEFELVDEGNMWETGDERLLEETFKRYTDLINGFTEALIQSDKKQGEGVEDYIERIIREYADKRDKQDLMPEE